VKRRCLEEQILPRRKKKRKKRHIEKADLEKKEETSKRGYITNRCPED
jgi:hypothetical protein